MKNIKLVLVAFLLSQFAVEAQFYQHSYGIEENEVGYSILRANENMDELVIAGEITKGALGAYDATLVKTDIGGGMIWSKVYGDDRNSHFYSVRGDIPHDDIAYVALGKTQSDIFGDYEVLLVGTDYNGNQLFSCIYGEKQYEVGKCLQVVKTPLTHEGVGLIMVGTTKSYSGKYDIYVILTDIKGNLISSTIITQELDMEGNWIEQTKNGDFVLTGYAKNRSGNKEVYVARLDAHLNIIWGNRYYLNSSVSAEALCIKEDPTEALVLTGYVSYGRSEDAFLIKLDPKGNYINMVVYNYGLYDRGHNIIMNDDPQSRLEYIVSGRIDRQIGDFNEIDGLLFKVTSNLVPIWAHRYGLERQEEVYEICKGIDDGYFITGRVNSFGFGNNDVYLVSTDRNGDSYTECDKKEELKIKEIPLEPVKYGKQDFVKWFKEFDVHVKEIDLPIDKCHFKGTNSLDIENGIGNSTGQLKAFPSPANDVLNIEFNDSYVGGELQVFDIMGKVVLTQTLNESNTKLSIQNLSEGIYILKVSKDDNYETLRFQKN